MSSKYDGSIDLYLGSINALLDDDKQITISNNDDNYYLMQDGFKIGHSQKKPALFSTIFAMEQFLRHQRIGHIETKERFEI
jgi:hypothetical protein